jgi:predicted acetyltransferase
LKWIDDDKNAGQELYFFMKGKNLLGAISIRPKNNSTTIGIDGHIGFGIRPSERRKGYATQMLRMALPILKERGVNPVVITCDKENVGSSKTIKKVGGILVNEVDGKCSGNPIQIFHIREPLFTDE